MITTKLSLGKYICGMIASLIIFLAGGWLILAPFALGYQPYSADWTNQTVNDFVTGIPVAVVALVGFVLFFYSLLGSLRTAGVVVSRPRMQQPQEAPTQYQPQVEAQQASASYQSDLDRTLAALAAALAADLNTRRQEDGNQQTIPQLPTVKRREA